MSTHTAPTPASDHDDRLLYIDEAAEMIRRSPAGLRALMHTGNAPRSAKIGGRRVFRESDVRAWIDDQFAKAV